MSCVYCYKDIIIEPKLKTYIYAIGESKAQAEQIAENLIASSKEMFKKIDIRVIVKEMELLRWEK